MQAEPTTIAFTGRQIVVTRKINRESRLFPIITKKSRPVVAVAQSVIVKPTGCGFDAHSRR